MGNYILSNYAVDVVVKGGKNDFIKYYNCYCDNLSIGKLCLVLSEKICGIYDFEVFPNYRYNGHGSNILNKLIQDFSNQFDVFFIQTWDENIPAKGCYENSGFKLYEKLIRLEKTDF